MIDLQKFAEELKTRLVFNAPVRTRPPAGPCGLSPYPGNLRQNGINIQYVDSKHIKIIIGGAPAPYGPYTETRSHKPGWIYKSCIETAEQYVLTLGGKIIL